MKWKEVKDSPLVIVCGAVVATAIAMWSIASLYFEQEHSIYTQTERANGLEEKLGSLIWPFEDAIKEVNRMKFVAEHENSNLKRISENIEALGRAEIAARNTDSAEFAKMIDLITEAEGLQEVLNRVIDAEDAVRNLKVLVDESSKRTGACFLVGDSNIPRSTFSVTKRDGSNPKVQLTPVRDCSVLAIAQTRKNTSENTWYGFSLYLNGEDIGGSIVESGHGNARPHDQVLEVVSLKAGKEYIFENRIYKGNPISSRTISRSLTVTGLLD